MLRIRHYSERRRSSPPRSALVVDQPRPLRGFESVRAGGARRIDPLRVDLALHRLGLVAAQLDLAVPASGEHGDGRAKIEAGNVVLLLIWLQRHAEQVRCRVEAGG